MVARAALAAVLFGACFRPQPQAGAACGDNGACPDPLTCAPATQTCELDALLDAPPGFADSGPAVDSVRSDAGCASFSLLFDTCALTATGAVALAGDLVIDTSAPDSGEVMTVDGQEILVITATTLSIADNATISVKGARPLAFVVFGAATIQGTIEVAAGARGTCTAQVGETGSGGGGGGGGGGFHGAGGAGGTGNADGSPSAAGGLGGSNETLPSSLLGGCAGGAGGRGTVGSQSGTGGGGGGAIAISVRDTLTLTGTITAPGGGGLHPPCANCGGGGGGSGGMVLVEATVVNLSGAVAANGGGGAGANGSQNPLSTNGTSGQPNENRAPGGSPSPGGSAGGSGSGGQVLGGASGPLFSTAGGGGGGGGAGYIFIRGDLMAQGTLSPPAITF